jgi:hypothetical protein
VEAGNPPSVSMAAIMIGVTLLKRLFMCSPIHLAVVRNHEVVSVYGKSPMHSSSADK